MLETGFKACYLREKVNGTGKQKRCRRIYMQPQLRYLLLSDRGTLSAYRPIT